MAKKLSLPGLYIINKISFEKSPTTKMLVAIFHVIDSYTNKKRNFRFDAINIAPTQEDALYIIREFIRTGQIPANANMSFFPTPLSFNQSITVACFDKLRNQPCLVRYTYRGENIGMLFFPHEFSYY